MTTPARTMPLGSLRLDTLSVSAMDNIAYLLTTASGEQLLVDAADDAPALLALLARAGSGPLRSIVTTHRHPDHHGALREVLRATGASSAAGAEDAGGLPVAPDRLLRHGDRLALDEAGQVVLDVVALRGHTPGSVALALSESADSGQPGRVHLFTGDSLFPGGVGRTTSPQDFTSLLDDVETRLFDRYPDDTLVWPGHGLPTTLGEERGQLGQWRARGW